MSGWAPKKSGGRPLKPIHEVWSDSDKLKRVRMMLFDEINRLEDIKKMQRRESGSDQLLGYDLGTYDLAKRLFKEIMR